MDDVEVTLVLFLALAVGFITLVVKQCLKDSD
jgi:hypothetical protein